MPSALGLGFSAIPKLISIPMLILMLIPFDLKVAQNRDF